MKTLDSPSSGSAQTRAARPLGHFWRVPLYSNALYLLAGSGLGAALGFVYWAVAARFYPADAVGLMSAAIAALGLLGNLANLSLGTGLIRFLPGSGKRAVPMINYSLSTALITTVVLAIVFLLGIGLWSPGLISFRQDFGKATTFVVFTVATALVSVVDGVFVAQRRAGFAMTRGLIMSVLKLVLVIALAGTAEAYGIFTSWGVALSISLVIGLFFVPHLIHGFLPLPNLDWRGKGELIRYSLINNLVSVFAGLPGQILPIMLLSLRGAEAAGYFFIAWQIVSSLALVPTSISTSLFAEGCHDEEELLHNARRSRRLAFAILKPVIIALLLFSAPLLRVFGTGYSGNSTRLLQLLSLSLVPMTVNQVWFSILRVHKRLKALTILNGVIAVVTLVVSYLLLPHMGTLGAGVGWVTSQTLVALWVVLGGGRGSIIMQTLLSPSRQRKEVT